MCKYLYLRRPIVLGSSQCLSAFVAKELLPRRRGDTKIACRILCVLTAKRISPHRHGGTKAAYLLNQLRHMCKYLYLRRPIVLGSSLCLSAFVAKELMPRRH